MPAKSLWRSFKAEKNKVISNCLGCREINMTEIKIKLLVQLKEMFQLVWLIFVYDWFLKTLWIWRFFSHLALGFVMCKFHTLRKNKHLLVLPALRAEGGTAATKALHPWCHFSLLEMSVLRTPLLRHGLNYSNFLSVVLAQKPTPLA